MLETDWIKGGVNISIPWEVKHSWHVKRMSVSCRQLYNPLKVRLGELPLESWRGGEKKEGSTEQWLILRRRLHYNERDVIQNSYTSSHSCLSFLTLCFLEFYLPPGKLKSIIAEIYDYILVDISNKNKTEDSQMSVSPSVWVSPAATVAKNRWY